MRIIFQFLIVFIVATNSAMATVSPCQSTGDWLQVLGSGGPEINEQRASTSYLLWQGGRARLLIDLGAGSMLHFGQTGARFEDVEAILLTHLHIDHTADLPAYIKASYFSSRTRELPLYGPTGNTLMPDTVAYTQSLFAKPKGAYRYLSGYLNGDEAFQLVPHNLSAQSKSIQPVLKNRDFNISAIAGHHGPIPALAYRVDIANHSVTFSGDMNGVNHTLPILAANSTILVAHHAIPESAISAARELHMPPSMIGEIASQAKVKELVLSHRMLRTLGHEKESERLIREHYSGPLIFAEDGMCLPIIEKITTK